MHRVGIIVGLVLSFMMVGSSIFSQDTLNKGKKLRFHGDFRFRMEHDWNSKRSDGTLRPDRFRLRYRARFGFAFQWSSQISLGARVRTGSLWDQQSPHITLGSEFQAGVIGIDKAFLKGKHKRLWWWLGKNTFPFWKQNELWWDDDVNPGGIALGWRIPASNRITLMPSMGYFIVRDTTIDQSSLIATQMAGEIKFVRMKLNFASGFFRFRNMRYIPDQQSSILDYDNINSGVKLQFQTIRPITLGFDYLVNLKQYKANADLPEKLKNETKGLVATVALGSLHSKGDFLVEYTYAQIGKFSVVDYLAQDDWIRWGFANATGTRSSNFKGHEVRTAYAFGSTFNAEIRIYFVKGIVPQDVVSRRETGNRIRLDLNMEF